jgi:hypothetical protein
MKIILVFIIAVLMVSCIDKEDVFTKDDLKIPKEKELDIHIPDRYQIIGEYPWDIRTEEEKKEDECKGA